MVTTSQLLSSQGISGLQKRRTQIKQISQPNQDIAKNLAEQKQYEADLAKYSADSAEYAARKKVYEFATTGRGFLIAGMARTGNAYERQAAGEYLKSEKEYIKSVEKQKSLGFLAQQAQAPTAPSPITQQAPGTYAPSTKSYISPEGLGYSMEQRHVPTGTKIVGETPVQAFIVGETPAQTIQRITQPKFEISTPKISAPTISLPQETQRYQEAGYTKVQATKLAQESIKQGGMSFTPERAKEIIKPKVGEIIKDVYIATSPITYGIQKSVERESQVIKVGREIVTKTKGAEKIESEISRLNRELKGITEVYGDEKTGTINLEGKKYEDYLSKYEKLEKLKKEYESIGGSFDEEGNLIRPTVPVGLLGRKEDISKFSGFTTEGFGGDIPVIGGVVKTVSKSVIGGGAVIDYLGASMFSDVGIRVEQTGIKRKEKEWKYKYTQPIQGTMEYNPLTGEQVVFKTYEGTYIQPELTSKEIGEKIYKTGSVVTSLGKYAIPYVGLTMFGAEIGERVEKYGGFKSYIKEKPGEALLTGGIILTAGALKGVSYLTKVRGVGIEGGIRYSTRAQDLFGKRVRLDTKAEKLFEVLPSERYKYQITKKALIPSEPRELISKVMKPELQEEFAGKTITYFDELTGTARQVKIGQKVIVETPKGILYGGEPYSKLGQLERKNVIEYLEKQGYTEKQIKEIIRLRQPQAIESEFLGKGKIIQTEEKLTYELAGTLKSQPISRITEGIPSRMGEGKIDFIKISGEPIAGGKEGMQLFRGIEDVRKAYLTKEGYPFSKLTQAGKTTEVYDVLSGTRKIKPSELSPVKLKLVKDKKGILTLEAEGAQLEYLTGKEFTPYRDISILRDITPLRRQPVIKESKFGELKLIEEHPLQIRLKEFRESLPKFEKAKFDKLTRESKVYWMEQVRAGSIVPDIKQRGVISGFEGGIEARKSLDVGYTILSKEGLLRKLKPKEFEYPLMTKRTTLDIVGEVKLPKGVSRAESIVLVEKGEPIIKVTDETIIKTLGIQGGGKPSSEQFFKQLYSIEEQKQAIGGVVSSVIKKELPIVKPPKIKPLPILETKPLETFTPLMVGGRGLKTIPYEGLGQYEYQEQFATRIINLPLSKTFVETKQQEGMLMIGQRMDLQFRQLQFEELKQELKQELKLKEMLKLKEGLKVQERLKVNELVKVTERLKQELKQELKTIPLGKQITSLRGITTPKIKVTPKIIIKILPSKGGVSKEISGGESLFEVYGRRFGKDIKLFEAKEKQKSKEELVKFLKTTLGRSGYVEKEGRKLSFEELGLSDEFTPSKTRRDVIVQKKEFALESLFERKEIKGARRKRRLF